MCYKCGDRIYRGDDVETILNEHPAHSNEGLHFPGVYIQTDFISEQEEQLIMRGIDEMPWDISQSGRRKQVNIYTLFNHIHMHVETFFFLF